MRWPTDIDGNHNFVEAYVKGKLPLVHYSKAQGTFLAWLVVSEVIDKVGRVIQPTRFRREEDGRDESGQTSADCAPGRAPQAHRSNGNRNVTPMKISVPITSHSPPARTPADGHHDGILAARRETSIRAN